MITMIKPEFYTFELNPEQKLQYLKTLQHFFSFNKDILAFGLIKEGDTIKPAFNRPYSVMELWSLDSPELNRKTDNIKRDYILKSINQRRLLPDEVVLDFDDTSDLELTRKKAEYIIDFFRKKVSPPLFYGLFYNGNSYHLHIFKPKLLHSNLTTDAEREKARKHILSIAGADLQLASEKHLIALEWCRHFKHNKVKTLVYGNWFYLLDLAGITHPYSDLETKNDFYLRGDLNATR